MIEEIEFWLSDEQKTIALGASLAQSIHCIPVTILCTGPLGSGKTTILKGFAEGCGVAGHLTSPTFALTQIYKTARGVPLTHMDLFRLSGRDAQHELRSTEEHGGIRCIEWGDRVPADAVGEGWIAIAFTERETGRFVRIQFCDVQLPDSELIRNWRAEVLLPPNVAEHCDAVAALSVSLGRSLLADGRIVRPAMLERAGMVHDLFRFIDFREGAGPTGSTTTPDETRAWAPWKERWKGMRHEEACDAFLRAQGFPELAEVVLVHGLTLPSPQRTTIEQKLLFYADKRVCGSAVVSLDERFRDFRMRYSNGATSPESDIWYAEAKRIERELFPDGPPLEIPRDKL